MFALDSLPERLDAKSEGLLLFGNRFEKALTIFMSQVLGCVVWIIRYRHLQFCQFGNRIDLASLVGTDIASLVIIHQGSLHLVYSMMLPDRQFDCHVIIPGGIPDE